MNQSESKSAEQREGEEIDFLTPAGFPQADQAHATNSAPNDAAPESETLAPAAGADLVDEADLKGIMANFNPMAIRDIATIEKGVEHFFLFNNSHLALIRPEQLQFLTPGDLDPLEERGALVQFQYIDVSPENRLLTRAVVVRPSSLKAEQVRKVKLGCIYGSAAALLRYVAERDRRLYDLEHEGELADHVSAQFRAADGPDDKSHSREAIARHLKALRVFSFEYLLEQFGVRPDLAAPLLGLFAKTAPEIEQELALTDLDGVARAALQNRMNRSLLFPLTRDFHLVQPPSTHLIDTQGGELREMRSEIEWIHLLFTQIARRILKTALPREESEWIEPRGARQAKDYLNTLKKHPSLSSGDLWAADFAFVDAYERLIKVVGSFKEVRLGGLVDLLAREALKPLNMNFEPFFFSMESFEVNHALVKSYSKKENLYDLVVERIKKDPEVFFQEERRAENPRPGLFLIYNYNLPRGFIDYKKRRNFLHLMAKSNGRENGIFDFLRTVKEGVDSAEAVREQIELARAIREWEDEAEKEREKLEQKNRPFLARLADWFLGLFGIKSKQRRLEDRAAAGRGSSGSDGPSRRGVLVGPKEKQLSIPGKVLKAIEQVEKGNHGLIWLDLVRETIGSTKYDEDALGDFLFFDKESRYTEVRALISLRRLFINKGRENDSAWVRTTIDYLDNITRPGPEIQALRDFLRNKLDF